MNTPEINELIGRIQIALLCASGCILILNCALVLIFWKLVESIAQRMRDKSAFDRRRIETQELRLQLDAAQIWVNSQEAKPQGQQRQGLNQESQQQSSKGQDAHNDFSELVRARLKKILDRY